MTQLIAAAWGSSCCVPTVSSYSVKESCCCCSVDQKSNKGWINRCHSDVSLQKNASSLVYETKCASKKLLSCNLTKQIQMFATFRWPSPQSVFLFFCIWAVCKYNCKEKDVGHDECLLCCTDAGKFMSLKALVFSKAPLLTETYITKDESVHCIPYRI